MLSPRRILRWMYIGRVCVGVAIFVAALYRWRNVDAGDTLAATLALFCAIAFTAGSAWLSSSSRRLGLSFFFTQSLFDLGLVTVVVHLTGSDVSNFTALYILVITVGSLMLPFAGGLLVAAIGIAMYWIDAIWGLGFTLPIGVALHLSVFAIVGFGSAYISARLRQAGAGKEELEAQLVLARLQADDILRNIGSGILTVDEAGRVLYANPSAGRMLGVTVESLIGKQVAQSLAESAPGLALALERTVRERIRIHRGEAVITSFDRRFSIGLTTTTIEARTDQSGVSATAIFQDITDNKRLEELRLRAERLEGVAELSASLAHEIKNPLASIRSAVEQLAASPRATEDEEILGKLIVRESDRLSRLLSEFLDFARVRVTRVDRVDIGAIAKTATSLAATHPDCKRGVQVTCVAPQEPVFVEGDEDLLHRAVFNIALNAVQAVQVGGSVKVEVSRLPFAQVPSGTPFQQDAIALRVTDDGPGIPDDVKERVFDPFFTTKSGGTGLGLPIAHRAIDAHRGILLVESTAFGTQFTVLLPHSPLGAGVPA